MKMKFTRLGMFAGAAAGALIAMPLMAADGVARAVASATPGTFFVDAKPEPFLPKFELPKKPGEDDGDGGGIQGDPLKEMTESLSGITDDLTAMQTGKPVQDKQQAVLDTLDKLIKQLEEQQKQKSGSGNGPGNGKPTKPAPKSQILSGPGGVGDLHAPPSGKKSLDAVSPRLRDQITQSQNEGFPPGYQQLLEQYYKKLAERRGEESAAPANPATPAPTPKPVPAPVTPAVP